MWAALDALVDRASVPELLYHRLGAFGARRRRTRGLPVEPELEHEERLAALAAATGPATLARVLAVAPAPVVVVKGLEVARRYPDPALRPYRDLDLLTADPAGLQRALLDSGFEVVNPGREDAEHHELGLVSPGLPMIVEVHGALKWLPGRAGPPAHELLAGAQPADDDPRVLRLPGPQHAVLVAVHAWAHRPLRRVLDLVDVLVVSEGEDRGALRRQAERWGVQRVWDTTLAAAEALLRGGPAPWPLRVWARDLPALRRRTVLEHALERWLAPFSALPPGAATRQALSALGRDLRPAPGETWREKAVRSRGSLRDAFTAR
jgi:hypothetical protein